MGRRRINHERVLALLPAGTLARMDAMLDEREPRAALIRAAIERELARRKRRRPAQVPVDIITPPVD